MVYLAHDRQNLGTRKETPNKCHRKPSPSTHPKEYRKGTNMKRSREPEEDPLPYQQTITTTSSLYSNQQQLSDTTGTTTSRSTSADASGSPPAAKIAGLDPTESLSQPRMQMKCLLPPHKDTLVFSTYSEYESHYNSIHTNRCLECRKNFPSSHLLGLHIEENHDSFTAVKRDKGEHTVCPALQLLLFPLLVLACPWPCRVPIQCGKACH